MNEVFKELAAQWHSEADAAVDAAALVDGLDRVMVNAKAGWIRILAHELELTIRRAENDAALREMVLAQTPGIN
jgi:hypothetical protein